MEKIFSTILRKFKMGKFFGEKTVLDSIMRNGVVLQIKIEFVAMEFVIFVQEILVTKAQIVVVIKLIRIRKTRIS